MGARPAFRALRSRRTVGPGRNGEVYRARDIRLRRDVALKVLPDRYASDAQRLVRFRREALALASLVHPHIATLFEIEESGTETVLVMELVDGETLDDRIARYRDSSRGRGLPLDEVLRLAGEIADALEAAHHCGVIHRDLKPANIKVRVDGSVKVLDFGLASIFTPDAHADVTGETVTVTGSQTMVGTPAYMSPEQARGESTDQRTDVWAFGCVLYEMLTGRRPFGGRTSVDVLACVLEREPDLTTLPADTPPAIRRLLRRTLSKNLRTRRRDMGDARLEISDAVARVEDTSPDPAVRTPGRTKMLYGAVSLVAVIVATLIAPKWMRPRAAPPPVSRFEITSATGVNIGAGLAISRDGSRLVLRSGPGFVVRQREKGTLETLEIGPAGEVLWPFFSPDGRWLGYSSDGAIKKVAVTAFVPSSTASCRWRRCARARSNRKR